MPEIVPPGLKPLDVDGVTASVIGTVAWAVALVVSLVRWDTLAADNQEWWVGTCAVGVVIGVVGTSYTARRRARSKQSARSAATG